MHAARARAPVAARPGAEPRPLARRRTARVASAALAARHAARPARRWPGRARRRCSPSAPSRHAPSTNSWVRSRAASCRRSLEGRVDDGHPGGATLEWWPSSARLYGCAQPCYSDAHYEPRADDDADMTASQSRPRPPVRLPPLHARRDHERTGPLMIVSGNGSTLVDAQGGSYLDAMAGLWCVNIGYGNDEMADALRAQTRRWPTTTRSRPWGTSRRRTLANRLVDRRPGPMAKVLLRQQRLGRERHPGQAGLVLQQRPRPAGEEEDHLPRARLPRRDRHVSASLCGLPGHARPASTCRCRWSCTSRAAAPALGGPGGRGRGSSSSPARRASSTS